MKTLMFLILISVLLAVSVAYIENHDGFDKSALVDRGWNWSSNEWRQIR